jgi:hypothetical protein
MACTENREIPNRFARTLRWTTRSAAAGVASIAVAAQGAIIDFEDFATPNTCGYYFDNFGVMPSSYAGFNWSTDFPFSGDSCTPANSMAVYRNTQSPGMSPSGFSTAIPQGTRAGFIPVYWSWGELRMSRTEAWAFHGAAFAGIWRNNVWVRLEGYQGTTQTHTHLAFLGAAGVSQQVNVNFTGIDRLVIRVQLGNWAGWDGDLPMTTIDNISYTVVPAPGALALFALAGSVRRRRAR